MLTCLCNIWLVISGPSHFPDVISYWSQEIQDYVSNIWNMFTPYIYIIIGLISKIDVQLCTALASSPSSPSHCAGLLMTHRNDNCNVSVFFFINTHTSLLIPNIVYLPPPMITFPRKLLTICNYNSTMDCIMLCVSTYIIYMHFPTINLCSSAMWDCDPSCFSSLAMHSSPCLYAVPMKPSCLCSSYWSESHHKTEILQSLLASNQEWVLVLPEPNLHQCRSQQASPGRTLDHLCLDAPVFEH